MMIFDGALLTLLKSIPALSGIAIRPDVAAESDGTTYVIYSLVSLQEGGYTLTGQSGLVPLRYQIDVYSPDKVIVNSLSEAVSEGLYQSINAILVNQMASFEADTRLHRMMLDMSILFDN